MRFMVLRKYRLCLSSGRFEHGGEGLLEGPAFFFILVWFVRLR
jgi:hypothetical protein